MLNYEDDLDYGNSRLYKSICLVNNRPRTIIELAFIKSVPTVSSMCIFNPDILEVLPIEYLDTTPIDLGYINGNRIYYAARMPSKQYRQGLRSNYILDLISGSNCIYTDTEDFYNMVINNYPSVYNSIDVLCCGESDVVAFHKKYAIGKECYGNSYELHSRGEVVGEIGLSEYGATFFNLQENKSYLSEELSEVLYV